MSEMKNANLHDCISFLAFSSEKLNNSHLKNILRFFDNRHYMNANYNTFNMLTFSLFLSVWELSNLILL